MAGNSSILKFVQKHKLPPEIKDDVSETKEESNVISSEGSARTRGDLVSPIRSAATRDDASPLLSASSEQKTENNDGRLLGAGETEDAAGSENHDENSIDPDFLAALPQDIRYRYGTGGQCGGSGSVEYVSSPWIRIRIKKMAGSGIRIRIK